MELYNQVKSSIEDPKVIEKLISIYANSDSMGNSFYSKLTKTVQKEHTKGETRDADVDKFYSMMFNKWKNSIVSMTRDEFIQLYRQGSYGNDLPKLRKYLKTIPDVTTREEAEQILKEDMLDSELQEAMKKYRWTAFGDEGTNWTHVCSRYVTAKKDEYPNVEHRLYLDTESLDTHEMITHFVEKCDKYHLPYYFKFDGRGDRDDTIVIYSSSETLTKYVEILEEIKREYPDLVSRAKEPPILTGKIDGWIGYGSEPHLPNGQKSSFNAIRSDIISNAIDKVTKKWIMDHRNMQITYHNERMNFQKYITMKSFDKWMDHLEYRYHFYEDIYKSSSEDKNIPYDKSKTEESAGFSLEELHSQQFRQKVYDTLNSKMSVSLSKFCSKNEYMDTISMRAKNNNSLSFSSMDFSEVIRKISLNIAKKDPNFIPSIQNQIKKDAKPYGIDTSKFCFDIKARESLKIATMKATPIMKPSIQKTVQTKSAPIPDSSLQKPVSVQTGDTKVLTNGSNNFSTQFGSSGENYDVMKSNIQKLGPIKEILKDHDLVKSIIAYNGDRHYFQAFIDLVNEELEHEKLSPDDLEVFNSGEVADAIVNIDETVKKYGNRDAYPAEKWDKLNYLSTIKDSNSYAASFTHPEILKAMANSGHLELTEWSKGSGLPPVSAFATILSEMLEQGSLDGAKEYLSNISRYSKDYASTEKIPGFSLPSTTGNIQFLSSNPNGLSDNKYGSSGENYDVMKSNIQELGPIKDVVKDPDLVKSIIAYNGDRHYFKAFIDLVNEGLESGKLYPDDLEVFNSGVVADAIVNIDRTAKKYGFRNAYPSEKLDKLNYLSTIKDANSFAASFTHPEILEAMADNKFSELTQWAKGSMLPPVTAFATIVSELIEQGNMDAAKNYINEVAYFSNKYSQAKRTQPIPKKPKIEKTSEEKVFKVEDTHVEEKSEKILPTDDKTELPKEVSMPFTNTINPSLVERRVTSTNGVEMPIQQYTKKITTDSNDMVDEDDLINQIDSIMNQYEQDKAAIYSSNIVSDEVLNRALAELAMENGDYEDSSSYNSGFRR